MSYDRMKFLQLTQELEALNKREGEITSELAKMFGGTAIVDPLGPITGATKGRPKGSKTSTKQPGAEPLQAVVLKGMESLRKPKTAIEIAERIRTKRPQTTNAAVASVLHHLAKAGKVVSPESGSFFLPAPTQTKSVSVAQPGEPPAGTSTPTKVANGDVKEFLPSASKEEALEDA